VNRVLAEPQFDAQAVAENRSMNSSRRSATLWGLLFPVLALVVITVILGFTRGGIGASTQTAAAPGSQPAAATPSNGAATTTSGTTASSAPVNSEAGMGTSGATTAAPDPTQPAGSTAANPTTPPGPDSTADPAGTPQGMGNQTANSQADTAAGNSSPSGSTAPTPPANTDGQAANGQANAAGTPGAPTPAGTSSAAQASAVGAQVYAANCTGCHGANGAGVAGAFPPMAGNKSILASETYVADVLLYGLQGQINVDGQTYNGVMPAWAAQLSDAEIAGVLDHIRSSWGNSATAVPEAVVKAERATPKTVSQVLAERPQQ
jgi:mono/diheme cytochrome c family protein